MNLPQEPSIRGQVGRIALLAALIAGFAQILAPTGATSADLSDRDALRNLCVQQLDHPPATLTARQRSWLRDCRDVMAPQPTPSPSASASPTASPTSSASASPSASPTPSPSTSPTGSPTPSLTPSPTATPGLNCMPQPSRCGYPDSTNTGVPAGQALSPRSGDVHLNLSGTYSNLDIAGCVYIEANNVILKNSRIRGDCYFSIRTAGISGATWTGLQVQDVEIILSATKEGAYGICCSNYTLTRVWVHGSPNGNAGADCVYFNTNVLVKDSFCEVGILPCVGDPACTPAHSDGMTSDGGRDVVLDHNTIRNPNSQTSGILLSTNSGPVLNTTVKNGLYAGGGYTVYCGTDAGGVDLPMVFTNNRIARDWNGTEPGYWGPSTRGPGGGYWGPVTHCADQGVVRGNNVWDDSNALIAGANAAPVPLGRAAFH